MALTDGLVTELVSTLEVVGVAGGFGYIHGREGTMPQVLGMDADVVAALGFHATGLLAKKWIGEKGARHAHSLGNGALAYLAGYQGAKRGQKDFKEKGQLWGDNKGKVGPRVWDPKSLAENRVTLGQPWNYRGLGSGPAQTQGAPSSLAGVYGY
jgi:hypothetical protein